MGAIGITDDKVWGASGRLIYSFINYSINRVGEKPYLRRIREAFDHGYNHFELRELDRIELEEFSKLLKEYIYDEKFAHLDSDLAKTKEHLQDLSEMVDSLRESL